MRLNAKRTTKPTPPNVLEIPPVIGIRTAEFAPLLERWAAHNRHVPWSVLLRRGMEQELKAFAGKRYSHLIKQ